MAASLGYSMETALPAPYMQHPCTWTPAKPSLRVGCVKESLRDDVAHSSMDQWVQRFRAERFIGSSSFDVDCAWLMSKAWGPSKALHAWRSIEHPRPIHEKDASLWLLASVRGGLPELAERAELAIFDKERFSQGLGLAAIRIGKEESMTRDPVRIEGLLRDLMLCCSHANAPFAPAADRFAKGAALWALPSHLQPDPSCPPTERLTIAEALRRSYARWEAREMDAASTSSSEAHAKAPRL